MRIYEVRRHDVWASGPNADGAGARCESYYTVRHRPRWWPFWTVVTQLDYQHMAGYINRPPPHRFGSVAQAGEWIENHAWKRKQWREACRTESRTVRVLHVREEELAINREWK